ncbi:MAG: hypothetical protein R3F46_02350 [bacterium]
MHTIEAIELYISSQSASKPGYLHLYTDRRKPESDYTEAVLNVSGAPGSGTKGNILINGLIVKGNSYFINTEIPINRIPKSWMHSADKSPLKCIACWFLSDNSGFRPNPLGTLKPQPTGFETRTTTPIKGPSDSRLGKYKWTLCYNVYDSINGNYIVKAKGHFCITSHPASIAELYDGNAQATTPINLQAIQGQILSGNAPKEKWTWISSTC